MDFIYNNGSSSGHRGVWHWEPDGVRVTEVPEVAIKDCHSVTDFNAGVADKDRVIGIEYYDSANYWRRDEIRFYPILGYTTSTVTTPAHESYHGRAACGSVSLNPYGYDTNLKRIEIYKQQTAKKNIGKHLVLVSDRIIKGPVLIGVETPPEPFCGHCYKKMESKGLV